MLVQLLQVKKAKLEAKDRQRIIECDQAKADLETNEHHMQELRQKADDIRSKLDQVKVRFLVALVPCRSFYTTPAMILYRLPSTTLSSFSRGRWLFLEKVCSLLECMG